ncbi:MAG: bifunctional demethylmenaquinone methyltransferase/2-methoxy-6-polyprenyl-1,4-benzoquinol methylase UbiE [Phycisphaerales bacterium]
MTPINAAEGPGAAPKAWEQGELANPHAVSDKAAKVRGMFGAIASSYDINNRVHSLWLDQSWRRSAVRTANVRPGEHVLDVACGTGDLTMAFARSAAAKVVGVDYTPQMLAVAEKKRPALEAPINAKVTYEEGDAQSLRFPDQSFDVVSIAFGIRNVADPAKALSEFARVLRPGGRLVVLEFERPGSPPFSWFYDFYCGWVMPRTATLISSDKSGAYKYLPASVGSFMGRDAMLGAIGRAGFSEVKARALTFGICICFSGTKR